MTIAYKKEQLLILISAGVFFVSIGISSVIFPTLLSQNGLSASDIAVSFCIELLASILISVKLPKLNRRINLVSLINIALLLGGLSILVLANYQTFTRWLVLIFFRGITVAIIMVGLTTLLNQFADNKYRGVTLAIFTMAICAGLSIGPIMVSVLGANNPQAFTWAAVFFSLPILPMAFIHKTAAKLDAPRAIPMMYFIKRAPMVFMAKVVQEWIITAMFALGVIYFVKNGYTYEAAGLLFSAFTASASLDILLGMSVDRFNKHHLINGAILGFIILVCLMVVAIDQYKILLGIFFLIGLCTGLIHLSTQALINNRFPKRVLVTANSALQLTGAISGMISTILAGFAMKWHVTLGLPMNLLIICACFLLGTVSKFLVSSYTNKHKI